MALRFPAARWLRAQWLRTQGIRAALAGTRRLAATRGGAFVLLSAGVAAALLAASLAVDSLWSAPRSTGLVRVRLEWARGIERVEVTAPGGIVAGGVRSPAGAVSLARHGDVVALRTGGSARREARLPLRLHSERPMTLRLPGGDHRSYAGDLVFFAGEQGGLDAVAEVPLEAYVAGVVVREMGPRFSLEALKAQAVAARSYALSFVAKRAHAGWDVRDSERSQVFAGLTEEPRIVRAVRATTGLVLAHGGSVLRAYYSSTCGGATAASAGRFGDVPEAVFPSAPCDDCRGSRVFRWTSQPVAEGVLASLSASIRAPVRAVEAAARDASGRWTRARVVHAAGHVELSAQRLRRSCSLRSDFIDAAERTAAGFVFHGRGWGHGVGMCQMGAQGMASRGASSRAILERYYPGAGLERIRLPAAP